MTYANTTAGRPRPGTEPTDNLDRVLIGACALIWLGALGAAVAATVALVDLAGGPQEPADDGQGTPWLLYAVIVVSALVIIGAIPLLLRARRSALETPAPGRPRAEDRAPAATVGSAPGIETLTGKIRMFGPPTDTDVRRPGYVSAVAPHRLDPGFPAAAVDQLWLRCTLAIASAMGVALIAIGAATYLMAVDSDTIAWVCFGVAGVITLAMPAIPWYFLRELRRLVG
jgi:hypothetical protein